MLTSLYHCTNFDSLCKILETRAFWPSFCYEKADYLEKSEDFAFAMVCFADLLESELKPHLDKFNKECYLRMKKTWARSNGISNVIYYDRNSILPHIFRQLVNVVAKRYEEGGFEETDEVRYTSMMMAYFKQYEGCYWNDKEHRWSEVQTEFFTEREWRYVPLVQNYEAYYISPDEFMDKTMRSKYKQELIDHGYVLNFDLDDIEQIGVQSKDQIQNISEILSHSFNVSENIAEMKVVLSPA